MQMADLSDKSARFHAIDRSILQELPGFRTCVRHSYVLGKKQRWHQMSGSGADEVHPARGPTINSTTGNGCKQRKGSLPG